MRDGSEFKSSKLSMIYIKNITQLHGNHLVFFTRQIGAAIPISLAGSELVAALAVMHV